MSWPTRSIAAAIQGLGLLLLLIETVLTFLATSWVFRAIEQTTSR